jgi:flagellin
MTDVSLNSGIRANLLQLQRSSASFQTTTERLASGKKVNSAIDNPSNFFAAVNLTDRAEGLSARLDGIGQAVQTVKAADNGISTIRSFVSAMKGVVNNALGNADGDARAALGRQFNELLVQVGQTAKDSSYQGVNLLEDSATQTVQFGEAFDASTLDLEGFDIAGPATLSDAAGDEGNIADIANAAGDANFGFLMTNQDGDEFGINGALTNATNTAAVTGSDDWSSATYEADLSSVLQQIEAFDIELKAQASNLSQNLASITIREEFSNNMINTLNEGADKMTLADLNEEGANLLALQTSTQLATQSLSLASQQSQGVLQLIG